MRRLLSQIVIVSGSDVSAGIMTYPDDAHHLVALSHFAWSDCDGNQAHSKIKVCDHPSN